MVINLSHLGERIEAALGDGARFGLAIAYSREAEPLETAGGIAQALPLLGDAPFAARQCRRLLRLRLCAAAAPRARGHALAHLVLVPNPPHHPAGDFSLAGEAVGERGRAALHLRGHRADRSPRCSPAVRAGAKAPLAPLLRAAADAGRLSRRAATRALARRRHARAPGRAGGAPCRDECRTDERRRPEAPSPAVHAARRAAARCRGAARASRSCRPRPSASRNRDTHYPYRFDSYFYYLTGFPEPEAVLVLVGGAEPRSILFCREKQPGARDLGRLPLRPGGGARALRLRRGASDRRARREARRAARRPAGAALLSGRRRCRLGRARHALAERGARAGARRRRRAARRRRTCARCSTRCAWSRTRTSSRSCAAPRDISAAAHRRAMRAARPGAQRIRDRGRAAVRVPPRRRAVPRLLRRSSPAAPTPACCTTCTTTRRCATATCC